MNHPTTFMSPKRYKKTASLSKSFSYARIMADVTRTLDAKTASILHAFYHLNKNQRRALLKEADKTIIKIFCESALNILVGNIPISTNLKKKLAKHKCSLRKLAFGKNKNSSSWQVKKKYLIQKGHGFLSLLLEPVVSALISEFV